VRWLSRMTREHRNLPIPIPDGNVAGIGSSRQCASSWRHVSEFAGAALSVRSKVASRDRTALPHSQT
jgi:hypothetical protein